jgi:hypothetical protein
MHVTIEVEDDETSPGPHAAFVLPRLVASSLGAMRNLQGIQLDLWWFSHIQRQELRDRCAGLPVWNGLRSIQMEEEANTELLAVLVSKTRPESFSGLQFGGQLELQAARQCKPFLRRLAVPFRLPASKNIGGRFCVESDGGVDPICAAGVVGSGTDPGKARCGWCDPRGSKGMFTCRLLLSKLV